MKKILAALLALSMLLVLAACGDKTEDDTTTTTTTEAAAGNTTDATAPTAADSTGTSDPTAIDPTGTSDPTATEPSGSTPSTPNTNPSTNPTTPTAPPPTVPTKDPSTPAEIVNYYNTATALVNSSKPGMKKVAVTKLLDDSIKGTNWSSNLAISTLLNFRFGDSSVRTIIGDFLKEGTINESANKGQNSLLYRSTITTDDLQGTPSITTSGNNYVLTFNLKGEKNPQKNGKSAMGRLTQSYVTGQEALDGIKSADTGGIAVNVDSIDMTTSNVKVVATIEKSTGKIINVVHSNNYEALIRGIKVSGIKLDGAQGNGTMETTYNNFAW